MFRSSLSDGDTAFSAVAVSVDKAGPDRGSRGDGWRTVEAPVALVDALARESAPDRAVLVDCLTLWLSNLMHAECEFDAESRRLADFLPRAPGPVILVSNEIGLVPDTPLGRRFGDAQAVSTSSPPAPFRPSSSSPPACRCGSSIRSWRSFRHDPRSRHRRVLWMNETFDDVFSSSVTPGRRRRATNPGAATPASRSMESGLAVVRRFATTASPRTGT
jgi:hypothetical protein